MNKLINSIKYGVNEQGYTMAFITCNTKSLYVASYATPYYHKDPLIHSSFADVVIHSSNADYDAEWVKIPFTPQPDENYTIVSWEDKNTISIIIVPISFVFTQ